VKKFIKFFLAFILAAFLSTEATANTAKTSADKNLQFQVSTNSLYYPGDKISINIYAYDYSARDKKGDYSQNFGITIYKIKDIAGFYANQKSRYGIDVLGRDSTNLTYLADEVGSFNKNIKSTYNYSYYYVNERIPINVTEKGAYFIKVTQGNQVGYCGFIISTAGIVAKTGLNSMLGFVVDRYSGTPLVNAELSFFLGTNLIGKGFTSNEGVCSQQVNDLFIVSEGDKTPLIAGKFNDDIVISDPYLYFGYTNRFISYVFTNQPVYRTDSEVLFKGTVRRKNAEGYETYSNQDVTVTIKDSRNAEVYKKVLRTNDLGSFDGSYKIDKEAALGIFTITTQIDAKNSSSINFSVEQYKKPEYKVTVKTDKSQYYGNDNLTATIEARYFFGSPVADADVEYNIYKVRYYKPWWAFSEWASWYEDYYSSLDDNSKFNNSVFIHTGKGKLNSEGKLDISYLIKEDFKSSNTDYYKYYWYSSETDYKYIVQAKVVDKSRRQISGLTTAFVTRGGFYLNAKCDKYLYKPGDIANIEVISNNFLDKPVQTDFKVNIFKNSWNRYDYTEKRNLVKTIEGKTKSDGKGIVTYNIENTDESSSYSIEVIAHDERGKEITTTAYFYVWKGGDYWWDRNRTGGIQILTDKDNYKKGDICRALIISNISDAFMLVTSETENIIYHSAERLSGTTKIVEFPITDKYNSNFKITASLVDKGQLQTSYKVIMLIPEEKLLTVKIEPSKEIYKPREEGPVKVQVTDYLGNPVRNAEVSVGIIDESIYSIKEETTKDIRKVFYGNLISGISTSFNSYPTNYSYSRMITIYEKYNIRSLKESELATVKGTLYTNDNIAVPNAVIIIDDDFMVATTDADGNFEFKLPEGTYTMGIYYQKFENKNLARITLSKSEIKTIKLYTDKTLNNITSTEVITIEADRKGIEVEQSGRLIDEQSFDPSKETGKVKVEEKSVTKNKKGDDKSKDKESDYKDADVRSDFRDAIFWSPYTRTDENGYAYVNVKYPDNLTEWRITSRVITGDTKVGQTTRTVITRKNLLVRMETPRFLQNKDELTISTIIHNYLSTEKKVKVKFRTTNVSIAGESEKTINIPSNSEQRLDWNIKVDNPYGEAKLYAEALTNEESDAVEIKVPLQPKGLEVIQPLVADFSEDNVSEKKYIDIPYGTDLRSTNLKFSVAPSLASTILSSLDELAGYPYGCVEQTMSRFLPTVVVASAFKELNAPINEATKKDLPKMVDAGLKRLYGFQHSDGGWGWWNNDATNPFMTAYVIYGLSVAKGAGYDIKKDVISKGITSMKNSLKNNLDPTTKAYILYTMAIASEKDAEKYKEELDKLLREDINDYARSLIAMTYNTLGDSESALKVVNELESRAVTSGESGAYWEGKSFHYNWQDDKVQTTAMGLKAIVNIKGSSELKNKIIRWLMRQRMGFSWRNTQETAMIIYAMVDYLKNSQELSPNYNVKIFVNGEKCYEKHMSKDDIFSKDSLIKIAGSKLKEGKNEIRIDKEGAGKVYFSSNTSYYWDSENISPREDGFRVEREYYKLEKYESYNSQNITYRKQYFDGTAKSGDMILVKIRVYSKEKNLNFFMLEDPIPAGCEVAKDDWAYRIEDEKDYSGQSYYWWRWWYADKDIRDNKVTFFATYLYNDSYEFSYIMRAQIPGDYNINPARGSLMYYTDVNGSTKNTKLRIID